MTRYSGITTDLKTRRKTHEDEKGPIINWTVANDGKPFSSREAAQKWENDQSGEHHPGGAPTTGPWFGYSFEYDSTNKYSDLKMPKR